MTKLICPFMSQMGKKNDHVELLRVACKKEVCACWNKDKKCCKVVGI